MFHILKVNIDRLSYKDLIANFELIVSNISFYLLNLINKKKDLCVVDPSNIEIHSMCFGQ